APRWRLPIFSLLPLSSPPRCRSFRRKLQALSNPSPASTPKAAPGDESNDSKRTPGTSPLAAESAHENRPSSSAAPESTFSISAAGRPRLVRTPPPAPRESKHFQGGATVRLGRFSHPVESKSAALPPPQYDVPTLASTSNNRLVCSRP